MARNTKCRIKANESTLLKRATLSADKDRTKNADMYFAALSKKDKDFYKVLFNKKMPNDETDEHGNRIGPAYYLKYNIRNQAQRDINVANERQGTEAFMKIMRNSRDFSNYVLDEKRMSSAINERRAKFRGYEESLRTIEQMRKNPESISAQDAAKAYRLFNYTLGNDSSDAKRQRARFFKELKNNGYGAVLDTNDAIYGSLNLEKPVIVFDNKSMRLVANDRVNGYEKTIAKIETMFRQREIAQF